MNRTYITYVLMILIFGAGLWAILRVGNRLRPARNISGEWRVQWSGEHGALPDRMTVAQSGKFITAVFLEPERGRGVRMKGQLDISPARLSLRGANPDVSMTATLDDAGQVMAGRIEGGASAAWRATRSRGR